MSAATPSAPLPQFRAPERRIGAITSLRRSWNRATIRRGGLVLALGLGIAALTWLIVARGPAAGRRAARLLHDGAERATALFDRVLPWRDNAPTPPPIPADTGSPTGGGPPARPPVTPLQTGRGRANAGTPALPVGSDAARVDGASDVLSGTRWGMTVHDVLAAPPHKVVRVDVAAAPAGREWVTAAAIPRLAIGESTFKVEFLFDASRRLRAVEMRPVVADDPRAFDELAAWVSSRHGAATFADEPLVRHETSSRRARWLTSTSVIDVESSPGASNRSPSRALHDRTAGAGGVRLIYTERPRGH